MNRNIIAVIITALIAIGGLAYAPAARAEQVTVVGPVTSIKLAPDGKSAVAVLKDNKSGQDVSINITDDLTLDKFKDKRIVVGDEIRSKFDKQDGGNLSKSFKKTAGC
mgnify:CR=1 FL=1